MRSRKSTKKQADRKERHGGLSRNGTKKANAKIVIDPVTGFPVLTLGPGAPVLTQKEVQEMLSDFP
jgi:hypothetical protein